MNGCVSIAQFPAPDQASAVESHEMRFICADGVLLAGHLWRSGRGQAVVIVNPATGVLARYYHRYAAFLAERGFDVVTYDYRGIGASRPASLRGCGYRWRDWGTLDFAAVLDGAERMAAGRPIMVVGHSIGGFLPGLAQGFDRCAAMISVAAQFAYWRDYERSARLRLVLRWHLIMPFMTALMGYFPGRRLGWLEDLPAGVAYEWAFRGPRVERSFPPEDRDEILRRLAAFQGPLLAITTTDDPYGAPRAIDRALAYYTGAERSRLVLSPQDLGVVHVGHFDLFHARHRHTFWQATAGWLESGGRNWRLPQSAAEPLPA